MSNHYLEILELQPGAGEAEIKAAYRKLSKKYHPDLNKKTSSREKFIAITEAYDFLLQSTTPVPVQPEVYAHDSYEEDLRKRREWARRKTEREAAARESRSLKVDRFIRTVNWFSFILSFVFLFEIILPKTVTEVEILSVGAPYEYQPGGAYSSGHWKKSRDRIRLETTKGNIEISGKYKNTIEKGGLGTLGKTLFYRTSMVFEQEGKKYGTANPIYGYWIFLPFTTLACSIVGIRTRKRSVLWNFGSTGLVTLPLMQFVIWWNNI